MAPDINELNGTAALASFITETVLLERLTVNPDLPYSPGNTIFWEVTEASFAGPKIEYRAAMYQSRCNGSVDGLWTVWPVPWAQPYWIPTTPAESTRTMKRGSIRVHERRRTLEALNTSMELLPFGTLVSEQSALGQAASMAGIRIRFNDKKAHRIRLTASAKRAGEGAVWIANTFHRHLGYPD